MYRRAARILFTEIYIHVTRITPDYTFSFFFVISATAYNYRDIVNISAELSLSSLRWNPILSSATWTVCCDETADSSILKSSILPSSAELRSLWQKSTSLWVFLFYKLIKNYVKRQAYLLCPLTYELWLLVSHEMHNVLSNLECLLWNMQLPSNHSEQVGMWGRLR